MPDVNMSDVIADVAVVVPTAHGDERGRFVETYRRSWFPLGREMVQANRSEKEAGAIVGLHYHLHQADYWYVLRGTARVVLHDLRRGRRPTAPPSPSTSTETMTGVCHPARCGPRLRLPHRPHSLVPGRQLLQPRRRTRCGVGRPGGRRGLGRGRPGAVGTGPGQSAGGRRSIPECSPGSDSGRDRPARPGPRPPWARRAPACWSPGEVRGSVGRPRWPWPRSAGRWRCGTSTPTGPRRQPPSAVSSTDRPPTGRRSTWPTGGLAAAVARAAARARDPGWFRPCRRNPRGRAGGCHRRRGLGRNPQREPPRAP